MTVAVANGRPIVDERIETAMRLVTPEEAGDLLASSGRNRHLRPGRVRDLTGIMQRGEWMFNGDTLRVDWHGRLIDGQHRLHAIVNSGTSQPFLIVSGLDPRVFLTIDIGGTRTPGDMLGIGGVSNANYVAAAAKTVWLYEQYGLFTRGGGSTSTRPLPTPTQLSELLDRHPDLANMVAVKGSLLRTGWSGGLMHLFSLVNADLSEWFWDRMNSGVDLQKGQPVHTLRERLLKVAVRGSALKMNTENQAAITVRAWNATLAGETLAKLPVPTDIRVAGCPIVPRVDR